MKAGKTPTNGASGATNVAGAAVRCRARTRRARFGLTGTVAECRATPNFTRPKALGRPICAGRAFFYSMDINPVSAGGFSSLLLALLLVVAVGGSMLLLTRQFLNREYQRRLLELRMKNAETVLPIRLQAYERICLFLERITPSNMLVRVSAANLTAPEYQRVLLTEIRNEYNHNVSQQIYMTSDAWQGVKNARETVVTLINRSFHELPGHARGTDLAKRILEHVIEQEVDPTAPAIAQLKRELSQVF